jgi:hypothetical protein
VLTVSARAPLERVFALSYGQAIPVLLGRLADRAAGSAA